MFNSELRRGSLEMLILSVLEGQTRHGYEIGKVLKARAEGQLELRVSTLYSLLYRMEKKGWLKGRWVEKTGQRRRCYYTLTDVGLEVLADQRQEWKAFANMVNHVIRTDHA